MTHRERQLLETLKNFRGVCREQKEEIERLWEANAALCLERDLTDKLLGEAMDLLSEQGQQN